MRFLASVLTVSLSLLVTTASAQVVAKRSVVRSPAPHTSGYRFETLSGGRKALRDRYSDSQLEVLEKLNRADLDHLAQMRSIVVPVTWSADELTYSPMPREYPPAALEPKSLVVHLPAQVFGAYENGHLVRWGPISSGRRAAQTPSGSYHLNWRSEGRHSTVDPDWFMKWYFNFDNREGLSLHEYTLPGHAASHGCIRLLETDAQWLYGWGDGWTLDESRSRVLEEGTPMLVLGQYDFGAPPPWRTLDALAHPIELPSEP
jgi:hypothetical protein